MLSPPLRAATSPKIGLTDRAAGVTIIAPCVVALNPLPVPNLRGARRAPPPSAASQLFHNLAEQMPPCRAIQTAGGFRLLGPFPALGNANPWKSTAAEHDTRDGWQDADDVQEHNRPVSILW